MFLLLTFFFLIIALEAPGLVRRKMWGELVVFGLFLSVGMILSLAQMLDISLPNPTKVIKTVYQPVADIIAKALVVE